MPYVSYPRDGYTGTFSVYYDLTSALLYLMLISLMANQILDTNLPGGKAAA